MIGSGEPARVRKAAPKAVAVADATYAIKLRSAEDGARIMFGFVVPYNVWTEIRSSIEGNFCERFLPRSLARSLVEDRARILVLFRHGTDPLVASKPIATVADLRDEPTGAAFAKLLDAAYVRENVTPGLEAGQFGTSGGFRVIKDEFRAKPARSETNPKGLPEVSVVEARLRELSVVTFPQYEGTAASMRSAKGGAAGELSLMTLTRVGAYGLGKGERWATKRGVEGHRCSRARQQENPRPDLRERNSPQGRGSPARSSPNVRVVAAGEAWRAISQKAPTSAPQ